MYRGVDWWLDRWIKAYKGIIAERMIKKMEIIGVMIGPV